jgi:allantoinase
MISNTHNVAKESKQYQTFLESRPKTLENEAIDLVIKLCDEYRVPCHIVHLASAEALPSIHEAKQRGIPVTVETTFHYLFFESNQVPEGATEFKCCPPIREAENREKLWKGLLHGTIDYVISDHSPCTADLKVN